MHTFAEKPKLTQAATLAKCTKIAPLENRAVHEASIKDDGANAGGSSGFNHDFSKIPVVSPARAASTSANHDNSGLLRSITERKYIFNASVRRASTLDPNVLKAAAEQSLPGNIETPAIPTGVTATGKINSRTNQRAV